MADIKITTAPPAHDEKILSAVESTLRQHNLRLKPGQDLAQVVDAITARGFKLDAAHGYLNASQTTAGLEQPVHVNVLFEALATQEPTRFFPRELDGVRCRDDMDREAKRKMLSTKEGLARFEAMPQTAPKEIVVVLDKTKLSRAEYLSLDLSTRASLCGQWGRDVIGQIMNRK